MRFSFRQLEYFVAVGEVGSITLAAERLHISQPSISTAIAQLERALGVQLFLRQHAQRLTLTPTGRIVLDEAQRLLRQAEGLHAVAAEAAGEVRGRLGVGCLSTLAPLVMPELAHAFTKTFPATEIRQVEATQEQLFAALGRTEIDIAVTYDLEIPAEIAFEPLASLAPHVWVGEADPLAQRQSVTLKELADLPLILLDLPYSRDYFLALFREAGTRLQIASRSTQLEVVRTMVANGYGYTLANVRPRSDLALDGRRIIRVPLGGAHRAMQLGLATLKACRKTRCIEAFETHCRGLISDAAIPGMAPADS